MFNRRNHFSVERGHKKRNRNMMKQSQGSDPWNTRLLLPVTPFLNCGCSHDQDTLKCPFLFENRIKSTYRIDPILHLTRFCSCRCHLQCKIGRQTAMLRSLFCRSLVCFELPPKTIDLCFRLHQYLKRNGKRYRVMSCEHSWMT